VGTFDYRDSSGFGILLILISTVSPSNLNALSPADLDIRNSKVCTSFIEFLNVRAGGHLVMLKASRSALHSQLGPTI
jgi:hypothetical protein